MLKMLNKMCSSKCQTDKKDVKNSNRNILTFFIILAGMFLFAL